MRAFEVLAGDYYFGLGSDDKDVRPETGEILRLASRNITVMRKSLSRVPASVLYEPLLIERLKNPGEAAAYLQGLASLPHREEVRWIWTSTPDGTSYVSGYTIVEPKRKSGSDPDFQGEGEIGV